MLRINAHFNHFNNDLKQMWKSRCYIIVITSPRWRWETPTGKALKLQLLWDNSASLPHDILMNFHFNVFCHSRIRKHSKETQSGVYEINHVVFTLLQNQFPSTKR